MGISIEYELIEYGKVIGPSFEIIYQNAESLAGINSRRFQKNFS